MSEQQKLLGFAQQSSVSPELEFLLHGCIDDNERNVVRYAFHAFARGDPGGFSIQFAVLLQAHARALRSVPERLRKVVAMELASLSDSLAVHGLSIKEAKNAIAEDADQMREGVVSLAEEIREIRTLINQMRETEIVAREKFLSGTSEERKKIQDAAESILNISAKRILMAIAAAYVMGIASYPVILTLVRGLWKQL
jgi:hypothetical protein